MNFDYYYGDESNQFAFYRIPRQLITGEAFKKLSTDAKLLYGLLLDRMGLSAKNGWYDDMGRVFIYYTLDEIQEDLNCGHEKAVRLLAELDTGKKGFGLIERVKQGQGRPTKLYVKRFTTRTILPQPAAPQDIPRLPIFGSQDFGKSEVKSSEKQKSRLPVIGSADFRKSDASYIESNQTDLSQLYPSIHPSATVPESRWIDRSECRREVQEAIEFPLLCQQFGYEDVESVTELIVDTLCSTRPTFRIGGAEMPAEQVKGRLQMLDNGHLEYVFDCMRRNTTEIRNIRAYLLTALYNAPVTMSPYYQAAVQHDFSYPQREWTGGVVLMSRYKTKNYSNRREYLDWLAERYGVDRADVVLLSSILGTDQDFDGLPSTLADLSAAKHTQGAVFPTDRPKRAKLPSN